MTRMPVVYVAGPYRASTREGVELNIQAARSVGLKTIQKGWSPIIPHCNGANLDLVEPGIGDAFWLAATAELLRRADAVVLVPGWENSEGTQAELSLARNLAMPVFMAVDMMPKSAEFTGLDHREQILNEHSIAAQSLAAAVGRDAIGYDIAGVMRAAGRHIRELDRQLLEAVEMRA